MATTTNITINDGTANQTFSPVKRDGGSLQFLNKVGAIVAAFKKLTLGFDLHSTRRATDKVFYDLDFPLSRVDSLGVTTANDVARARTVFTIPDTMTAAEKLTFYTIWKNGAAHSATQAYVVDGDPML